MNIRKPALVQYAEVNGRFCTQTFLSPTPNPQKCLWMGHCEPQIKRVSVQGAPSRRAGSLANRPASRQARRRSSGGRRKDRLAGPSGEHTDEGVVVVDEFLRRGKWPCPHSSFISSTSKLSTALGGMVAVCQGS